jgi:hypothetical protein
MPGTVLTIEMVPEEGGAGIMLIREHCVLIGYEEDAAIQAFFQVLLRVAGGAPVGWDRFKEGLQSAAFMLAPVDDR